MKKEKTSIETFHLFLETTLTSSQITVLRYALKIGQPVYFYGRGLGKSLLTNTLRDAGYKAMEPGSFDLDPELCHLDPMKGSLEVLDGTDYICFNVKTTPKKTIHGLHEALRSCKDDIKTWVNLCN